MNEGDVRPVDTLMIWLFQEALKQNKSIHSDQLNESNNR